MKKWVRNTLGVVLAVIGGSTVYVATQQDVDPGELDGKMEVQYIVDPGTKASFFSSGQIIQVKPVGFSWGRCSNPLTQADIDYCKGRGAKVLLTVETLPVSDSEATTITDGLAVYKVDDVANPTAILPQ